MLYHLKVRFLVASKDNDSVCLGTKMLVVHAQMVKECQHDYS